MAASVLGRTEALYRSNISGESAMKRGADDQQLLVNYRGSSLGGPPSVGTILQPGDRMPNGRLRSASGAALELFDLMRGPHGLLLAIDRPLDTASAGETHAVTIGLSEPAEAYDYSGDGDGLRDLTGRIVKVRPDGYIQDIAG